MLFKYLPLLLTFYTTSLFAQFVGPNGVVEMPPTVKFSASYFGLTKVPTFYYQEVKFEAGVVEKEYKRLNIGNSRLGRTVELVIDPSLALYQQFRNTETGATDFRPVIPIQGAKPDGIVRMLIYYERDGTVGYTFIDDSPEVHPAQQIRMANFSQNDVVATVGDKPVAIRAESTKLIGAPVFKENNTFPFEFATTINGTPYREPLKYLRFRDETQKLLVVYANNPVWSSSDNGDKPAEITGFSPKAYRMYSRVK